MQASRRHAGSWSASALALVAALLAPIVASAQWAEVQLEPLFVDCDTSTSTPGNRIYPNSFGNPGGAGAWDLDNDSNTGIGASSEDDDGDAVFGSFNYALDNVGGTSGVAAGGIVHLTVPGIYREAMTIAKSMTVRAPAGTDVILEGSCYTPGGGTGITVNAAAGDLVVLENLTLRGFTTAVDLSGSNAAAVVVFRNCRFQDNTTAIKGKSGLATRVIGCTITDNGTGITDVDELLMVDSEVSGSTTDCIVISNAGTWRISGSLIADNADGLLMDGSGTGTGLLDLTGSRVLRNRDGGIRIDTAVMTLGVHDSIISGNGSHGIRLSAGEGSKFRVTDSLIDDNTNSGIYVLNQDDCTALAGEGVAGLVVDSRVLGNGDDGISIGGSSAACNPPTTYPSRVYCGLLEATISANGGYGIVARTTNGKYHCGVGLNQLSYNGSGAESGTGTVCTNVTSTSNQAN